jgi:conjugal transfer pilus assembly protein TraU
MKRKKHITSVIVMLTAASWLVSASVVHAATACSGTPINPITDICWQCMFPAQIGSVSYGNGQESAPGNITSPACVCPDSKQGIIAGLSVAFWEHARMIETVKDPYCFPILGTGMTNPKPGFSSGTARGPGHNDNEYAFQQAHYYTFPAWSILKLFMDFPCAEQGGFDLAYMTEVDPMWNDDSLSFIINPEALLFGNPVSQVACVADSVAATVSTPIDPLFWCMGSWGSFYPLTGSMNSSEPLSVNAGLAARMLFKLGRESLLFDTGINQCSSGGVITPILVKSNYRLQIVKPVRGTACNPIGRPSLIWGSAKNPPWGAGTNSPDNFLWSMTRRRVCCVGYGLN